MSERFVISIAPLDPNSTTPKVVAIATPVEGVHPEHPIVLPPNAPPRPAHPIYLPPHPTHPIVIPPPPEGHEPGVPTHPIYIPGYPAHPIVIPPWNDPKPEHPIVLPPEGSPPYPAHPIVLPPEIWPSPGQPSHPIVIPPLPPLYPEICLCTLPAKAK